MYQDWRLRTLQRAFDFFEDNHVNWFPIWGMRNSSVYHKLVCDCYHGIHCMRSGKHPYRKDAWLAFAQTNTISTSDEWLAEFPNSNLAVCTGEVTHKGVKKYLVVVDIDNVLSDEQYDFVGENSLPDTFEYKTGGSDGGKHLWYWSDKPIQCSVGKLANHVDIRGVGGYVIVPPSCHKSGKHYEVVDDSMWNTPIAEIPVWLQNKLIELDTKESVDKSRQRKKPKNKNVKKASSVLETSPLAQLSVGALRKTLLDGNIKIPEGMRNNTLLRLLGSDRATQGSEYEQLLEKAFYYRDVWCDVPSTIPDSQLVDLATQVATFPKGFASSDHTQVNANYVAWMQARFKGALNKSITLERLEKLDNEFFSMMIAVSKASGTTRLGTPKYDKLMTLSEIATSRESFMITSGMGTYSKYRSQFLAKKLEELGAVRVRTSKGNLWNVAITSAYESRLKSVLQTTTVLTDDFRCATLRNQITETVPEVTRTAAFTTTLNSFKQNMTIKTTSTNEIKFSRKDHPSERRYVGFSCFETQNAVNQCLELLESDDFTKMFQGTLIYDEDTTAEFFDEIQVGDIVGLVTHEDGGGWVPRQYKVLETKVDGEDKHLVENRYGEVKTQQEITFEQCSIALLLGYAEILKRDDKPYGLSDEEMEMKIVIKNMTPEAEGKDLDEAVGDVTVMAPDESAVVESAFEEAKTEVANQSHGEEQNGHSRTQNP